jgi:membrane fusion protein
LLTRHDHTANAFGGFEVLEIPSFHPVTALEPQADSRLGGIVMAGPVSYRVLVLLFAMFACGLVTFCIWGSYTERVTVSGQLVPDKGLVKVYVQQPGIVIEQHVVEGQRVTANDVLFVLSSERQSSTMGETQAAISRATQAREQSLREELAKTQQMRSLERESLLQKIAGLRAELSKLSTLIADQQGRYQLAINDYTRYQGIQGAGYVTQDQLTQRQADVLDQKSRLEGLERDDISTRRTLTDAQYQLDTLGIKYGNQIGDIERNIASAEQDLSESEARRQLTVIAPAAGIATAITVHVGQVVDSNKPLVAILPDNSKLHAELYAPSRAVGFVRPGDEVNMRYQAYPYQKFGQYRGRVSNIASTSLSSAELTGTNDFGLNTNTQPAEPLYRISIDLESQTVTAYGQKRNLNAGMLLDADVLREKRRLYEWVLAPLYTLTGKL